MKSVASRLVGITVRCLMTGLFLAMISGAAFAQIPVQGVLQDAAKDAAKEAVKDAAKDAAKSAAKDALGIKKPVAGHAEMMDGCKKMMEGKQTLKEHLRQTGKLKKDVALEGETMMTRGRDTMVEGDKLIKAGNTAPGKKKLMDGSKMMTDAREKMVGNLTGKGVIDKASPPEGVMMMEDGEKMMKKGEMTLLK